MALFVKCSGDEIGVVGVGQEAIENGYWLTMSHVLPIDLGLRSQRR